MVESHFLVVNLVNRVMFMAMMGIVCHGSIGYLGIGFITKHFCVHTSGHSTPLVLTIKRNTKLGFII